MFRQLLLLSAVLVVVVLAQMPFQLDEKQAVADMEAAGIKHKIAELLVKREKEMNEKSAKLKAKGDAKGLKQLQDEYKRGQMLIEKAMPKDQLEKYLKFLA